MVEAVKRLTGLNKCPLPLNWKPNVGERKSMETNEWRPQRPSERWPEKAKAAGESGSKMNYWGSQYLPRGNNNQMNWVLTLFFFFPNFDHFISPSNNPVSVVLVFSLFYQCYGCTENSSNVHKLTWLANFKACIWTPIWMPLWVVLLNTTLNSLTEESIQRVYPDNSRARTTIHFKASPRLV